MAGCVGRDDFGRELLETVSATGVDTRPIRSADAPTGLAVVVVDDAGENRIVVAGGANAAPVHGMATDGLLARCSTLLLQLEVSPRETFALARRAKEAGKRVVLNAAPAGPVEPDVLDLLIVNEGEAARVAAQLGMAERAAGDVAGRFAADRGLAAVVTLGAGGALAAGPGGRWADRRPADRAGRHDGRRRRLHGRAGRRPRSRRGPALRPAPRLGRRRARLPRPRRHARHARRRGDRRQARGSGAGASVLTGTRVSVRPTAPRRAAADGRNASQAPRSDGYGLTPELDR